MQLLTSNSRPQFLTIWGVHFQMLAGILNILVLLKGKKWISIRDKVHHSLSLPFGIVSVLVLNLDSLKSLFTLVGT